MEQVASSENDMHIDRIIEISDNLEEIIIQMRHIIKVRGRRCKDPQRESRHTPRRHAFCRGSIG
jgi:hypothetical protein